MTPAAPATDYHAKYLAHLLLKRGGSDKLERLAGTMRDARIELTPHQVEAALFSIADNTAHSIAGGALIICLDDNLTNPAIQAIATLKPVQCICLDAAFHENDQLKTNAVQTMESARVQFRTV